MVSADEYYAGLEESAEDPEMLDLLYADGIIDADEWWERKHG